MSSKPLLKQVGIIYYHPPGMSVISHKEPTVLGQMIWWAYLLGTWNLKYCMWHAELGTSLALAHECPGGQHGWITQRSIDWSKMKLNKTPQTLKWLDFVKTWQTNCCCMVCLNSFCSLSFSLSLSLLSHSHTWASTSNTYFKCFLDCVCNYPQIIWCFCIQ